MAISFDTIPSTLRTPFVAAEFDATRASQGPSVLAYRGLLIGQMHSGGSASANSLHKVTNADQVATLAGRGSQLHRMALAWFAENTSTEVWIGVLADDVAAVAASGTITYTGPATAAGTISLYVGGTLVRAAIASGDDATAIASAVKTAIGAAAGDTDLPVHASSALGVVTVTANNKGAAGNEIDLRHNYQSDSEALPAGVGATIVAMSSGATNPTLTALVAAMGDSWYNIVAHPYTDATSLTAIESEMASRAGPLRMIDGLAITATGVAYASAGSLGSGRNAAWSSIVRAGGSPTSPAEYAASVAGVVAYYSQIDPARPLQTLPLTWVKAPVEADRDTLQERNLLLYDGISTTRVGAGGVVQIDRMISTYQKNAAGSPDTAYLSVETVLTLMYLRYAFRNRIQTAFPRHKLADDGTRFGAGQAVATPKIIKAEAVSWFRDMEDLGLVENFDQFKTDLVVERNVSDPTRVDILVPPNLINQFIVGAAKIQFIL